MSKFKIRESYLLLLIVLGLVSLGIYTTYALFTASTTINDVVGITATLDIGKSLTEYEVITVPSGETKLIELNVVNSYKGNIYYGAWYQIVKGNIDDIQIGLYTEKNSNPGSGSLSASSNINLLVGITNDNSTSVTLYVGVKGSLTNELNLGTNKTLIPDGFSEALLVTDEVLEAHKETKTDTIEVENEVNKEFSATGAVQNVTLNAGTYKLQVWGAEGGYGYTSASSYPGGKGGYSYGTLTLNETTNLYVYIGEKGKSGTSSSSIKTGGFNGGGNSGYSRGGSGGGATDIRIGQDSLYARVIVAGGGGGGAYYAKYYGGAGGGTSAIDGTGYNTTYNSKGGTQTAGGTAAYYGTSKGTDGSFGHGGAASTSTRSYNRSGGGGGGWYGGGGGAYNSSTKTTVQTQYIGVSGGGGGSGYVYTSSTASSYPSGCLLNSSYYLTDAATIAGNTSFESTSGGTEIGHSNAGYAKITGTEIVTTTGTVTYYTIPNLTGLTDLSIPLGTSVSLTDGTTLICENNTTTGCSITSISITDTSTLTEGTHVVTYTVKGANNKKYLFNRNIIIISNLDVSGANTPDLVQGLIPVMYNGSKWVKADSENTNETYKWYDYNNKLWANAVLVTSTNRSTYQSANPGTTITESDILAYYVWIPRYKYKVWNINKVIGTDSYNAQTTGIDIVFESEKESTGTISCNYDFTVTEGSGLSETCTGNNGDYYTHPAFTFGSDNIRGFWIGKFELTGNSSKLTVLPNVSSLRSQTISSFSTMIQNIQISGNIYGLSTSRAKTDSHMLTNYEWGAVAYLTNSKYGRCTDGSCTEVTMNNCEKYITGIGADTVSDNYSSTTCTNATNKYNGTKGVLASTTGNITGVYDMNEGTSEYVMGNMSSASGSYTFYPESSEFSSSWYTTSMAKYVTAYANGSSGGDNPDQTTYNRGRLGDATSEVVLSAGGYVGGWYLDEMFFPGGSFPWFSRSGGGDEFGSSGVFSFEGTYGESRSYYSSRSALVSLSS